MTWDTLYWKQERIGAWLDQMRRWGESYIFPSKDLFGTKHEGEQEVKAFKKECVLITEEDNLASKLDFALSYHKNTKAGGMFSVYF